MKQLIELIGAHAQNRFFFVDEFFGHHINGNFNGGRRRSFSTPSLQHVEFTLFDGELDVLHIAVMFF